MNFIWTSFVMISCIFTPAAFASVNPSTNASPSQVQKSASYTPELGELMLMSMQPHHIKLGIASRYHNWELAAHEIDELKETIEAIEKYQPHWHGKPTGQMSSALFNPVLEDASRAIKDQNISRLQSAYAQLTQACNACHQANGMQVIVIKSPECFFIPGPTIPAAPT